MISNLHLFILKRMRGLAVLFACGLWMVWLSACSSQAPVVTSQPAATEAPTSAALAPSATFLLPSATPTNTIAPTATATQLPTNTPTPPATATSAVTATLTSTATAVPVAAATLAPASQDMVLGYFIHQGTGGPVACGDSLVPVSYGVSRSGDVATDVKAALQRLFSTKSKNVGALYNSLYPSNIDVTSVSYSPSSGIVSVRLAGTYVRSGDRCDNSRSRAQVWTTIRQFPGVKVVDILLNGNLLGDILANDR